MEQLGVVLRGTREWMEEKGYQSLAEMRGCMNIARCPDPAEYRRGNYMRVLRTWPAVR
jgi:dihydroorotate dehydrogenase (fumarate)